MSIAAIISFIGTAARPLLVLVGPTASGKTDLSLSIAEGLRAQGRGVEIINADSRQLYCHLDIGTGKIRPEEMRGIPHHLLNVLDPKEGVTAAWYKAEAERVIGEIHARGNIPFLVGGSMLYVSAVIDNLQFVKKADRALRERLEEEYDRDQGATLYRRLAAQDPETAVSFDRRNKPYVVRAMEILESIGTPSGAKRKEASPYDLLLFGLAIPRAALVQKIDARVEQMFADGWLEEVRSLLARGYRTDDPGLQSVGYRDIVTFLERGEPSLERLKESIKAQSRQYARRQMTWWRRDERIHWIVPSPVPQPYSGHPLPDGEGKR